MPELWCTVDVTARLDGARAILPRMWTHQLWRVAWKAACLAPLVAAACATQAPPTVRPTPAAPSKDSDAIALLLVVESAGSAEDERSGAERAFRERLDSSSRFTLNPGATGGTAPFLRLRLTVGGVLDGAGGISQKLVLTGAIHDGSCQVFQFAPVLTKPGAKTGDARARKELLDTGLGDLIGKLESSSSRLGNATCLATGPTR